MIINIDQSPDMLPPGVEDEPAGVEVPGTKEPAARGARPSD